MISPVLPTTNILYENPAWIPPLADALATEGFRVRLVHVNEGSIDPSAPPPDGIWMNRISPSSHTRGHVHTVELARQLLYRLESSGCRVINGLSAFELEMSKLRQDLVLRRHRIRTPRTVLAVGREHLLATAATFDGPFITKHDQGGKGLGIRLFHDPGALAAHLDGEGFDAGPGARMILQEYISAPEPFITRVEIVGGRFLFAMRSSTTGGFELCPSDVCNPMPRGQEGLRAGARGDIATGTGATPLFSPSPITADDPLVRQYIRLCADEGIEIAGIEFVEDARGNRYTYDINGTTNYNQTLGARIGVAGMREVARYVRAVAAEHGRLRTVSEVDPDYLASRSAGCTPVRRVRAVEQRERGQGPVCRRGRSHQLQSARRQVLPRTGSPARAGRARGQCLGPAWRRACTRRTRGRGSRVPDHPPRRGNHDLGADAART